MILSLLLQEYIPNPMLISGYKFDLRVYVMVPSFQPLHAYVYEEGLVRFSTEKYDLGALGNMFAHLTNTSINKHSPAYSMDKVGAVGFTLNPFIFVCYLFTRVTPTPCIIHNAV